MPLQASDKLIQFIEYIGADYKSAVAEGQIINAAEYAEMVEFASLIPPQLPDGNAALLQQSELLQQLIKNKAEPADIQQLTAKMRQTIIAAMPQVALPAKIPDLQRGQALYQSYCAACHGANAQGDGLAAKGLDPEPTNFHEFERYEARSIFGLFNTITLGVEETAMTSFSYLDEQSRWDMAFYVGAIASEQVELSNTPTSLITRNNIQMLLTSTPQDVKQQYAEQGEALMAVFRQQPERFFSAKNTDPLQVANDTLSLIIPQLEQKQYDQAYNLAVAAYLDGFELIENNLAAVDLTLKDQIENKMLGLRQHIKQQAGLSELTLEIQAIQQLLSQAEAALDNSNLASGNVFLLALLILLREGLEALLVVAAIYSVAVKTEQPALKRSVHYGWISALALGGLTWFIASYVITISGASREMTEGYTALIAAAILFYMGFWMHSKTSNEQWQQFINNQVGKALKTGAYFGLGTVVFLAVYREIFETILFYQSLWLQGGAAHQMSFILGIIAALGLLAILGIGLFKFALKLPLKAFFGSTALLMIVLAFVMTGKGIAALQEAGVIAINQLNTPTISWLGIYPTVQSLAAQLILLVLATVILLNQRKQKTLA